MNIRIVRLELTNFKCFQHKEISFDSQVTTIRGRNGVGKTTIADAILWCLFGKDSLGRADFSIKTHDGEGNDIPHLDHSVEMLLDINEERDGVPVNKRVTLRRTLREQWVKKRATDEQVLKNNTTEYLVNGEVTTAADYKKYIASLISEDIFRAITNPAYFPSLKWQQQRDFLTKMVGSIPPEDFADTDELADLVRQLDLSGEDIIAHRKHLFYQIKQVKDKLDRIPVRLEEQNKALPEPLDWDRIKSEAAAAKVEHDRISDEIVKIKQGNGSDVLRDQIRNEIRGVQESIDKIEAEERNRYRIRQSEHDHKIAEASRRFNSLVTTQRDLESQSSSFETLIKRCQDTLDQCERDAQSIRDEWAHNQSRTFHFHAADGVCPTCGQYLPEYQIAEKCQKAEENLNADKARIKEQLTQRAEKVKATRAEAEAQIKDYTDKKAEAEKNLTAVKEQINTAFADKAKLEKEPVLSLAQSLDDNAHYQELLSTKAELQRKLDSVGIDSEAEKTLADLEQQKVQCAAVLQQLNLQLATRTQYDRIQSLIAGIEQEQHDLITQLSDLEKREDIARQYQDRQNAILESRVNEHFDLVKWRMFRTVNNGGEPFDEPWCEPFSPDGSAYHDGANQAMRLNMGLDICNALCRHYSVSAPIIIDQSESTLNIINTIGQQVRLQVADTDFQIV